MARSVEVFAIILFGVIGLSHLLQPKAWAEYFILLRGKGEAGAFVDGFVHLPLAGFIIAFHNVWSGIPAVLTFLGWCFLIKSLIRFCLPKLGVADDGAGLRRAILGVPSGRRRPCVPCRTPWLWGLRQLAAHRAAPIEGSAPCSRAPMLGCG